MATRCTKTSKVKSIKTRIYMQHAPEDHGVVAHFIIQDIARLAGIRNMIASVKGNVNQINIVRGVFQGLLMQQDHVAKMKEPASASSSTTRRTAARSFTTAPRPKRSPWRTSAVRSGSASP